MTHSELQPLAGNQLYDPFGHCYGYVLNLGIVFGILDYSVDYSASSDIRLMTKIRILYSAVFFYSVF